MRLSTYLEKQLRLGSPSNELNQIIKKEKHTGNNSSKIIPPHR
jgi:hypothetical protein